MEFDNDECCGESSICAFFKRIFGPKPAKPKITERGQKRLEDGYTDRWELVKDSKGVEVIRDTALGRIFPKSLIPSGTSVEEMVDNLNEPGYQQYLDTARSVFNKTLPSGTFPPTK